MKFHPTSHESGNPDGLEAATVAAADDVGVKMESVKVSSSISVGYNTLQCASRTRIICSYHCCVYVEGVHRPEQSSSLFDLHKADIWWPVRLIVKAIHCNQRMISTQLLVHGPNLSVLKSCSATGSALADNRVAVL